MSGRLASDNPAGALGSQAAHSPFTHPPPVEDAVLVVSVLVVGVALQAVIVSHLVEVTVLVVSEVPEVRVETDTVSVHFGAVVFEHELLDEVVDRCEEEGSDIDC